MNFNHQIWHTRYLYQALFFSAFTLLLYFTEDLSTLWNKIWFWGNVVLAICNLCGFLFDHSENKDDNGEHKKKGC